MSDAYLPLIEEMLARSVSDEAIPKPLRESMAYSLVSGGKRLRPRICLACCALADGSIESALPLACGVEMIHAYSLIHDDLPCMDDDDFRRGKPANHIVYGEAGAVLAGDALLTHAFEWMLAHAPDKPEELGNYVRAVRVIAEGAGARGMVAGQSLELSGALEAGKILLEEVHSKKTGALLRAAALAGGYAAGADDRTLRALDAFAAQYGALFQIADDIADAAAEKGSDKNCVSVYGLERARSLAQQAAYEAREALRPCAQHAQYLMDLIEGTLRAAIA